MADVYKINGQQPIIMYYNRTESPTAGERLVERARDALLGSGLMTSTQIARSLGGIDGTAVEACLAANPQVFDETRMPGSAVAYWGLVRRKMASPLAIHCFSPGRPRSTSAGHTPQTPSRPPSPYEWPSSPRLGDQ